MTAGSVKGGKVFGRSCQLLLNKFFDPNTPSVGKGCGGEEDEKKRENKLGLKMCQAKLDKLRKKFDDIDAT